MALPLIPLAAVAIRYGSKKLAKHLIKPARKKVKKRNTTPKREYNRDVNPRQNAKEFKKITGESIKILDDKPRSKTTYAMWADKKKDSVYRGMTPGILGDRQWLIYQRHLKTQANKRIAQGKSPFYNQKDDVLPKYNKGK